MSFFFPKRKTLNDDETSREEFDQVADAIRLAYAQVQTQPQITLEAIKGLFAKVKAARSLERRQRDILNGYIYDAAGYAALEIGQTKEALVSLQKAAKIYVSLTDKMPLVNNLLNQSRALTLQNKLTQALVKMEESLTVTKENRLPTTEAEILYKLGMFYNLVGQPPKALDTFKRGLLLCQQIGNLNLTGSFLTQYGQISLDKGEVEKAQDYFERSQAIFEQTGDTHNLLVNSGQLGQLYRKQGNYPLALELANKGLVLAREQAERREETIFLQDLARINLAQEDYATARAMAQESLSVANEQKLEDGRLQAYELLVQIALGDKDFSDAEQWANNGYELSKDWREKAIFLNDFADIKLAQTKPSEAIEYFERLADIFKEQQAVATLATLYVRMGNIFLKDLQDPTSATRMVQAAFELAIGNGQEKRDALFAFTSMMQLIQALAKEKYYTEGLLVASQCLEQLNKRLSKHKNNPESTLWLLFRQVLIVLVATLQDLKTGKCDYQIKVKEMLIQLTSRYGDTFTLESWTSEMYERLK